MEFESNKSQISMIKEKLKNPYSKIKQNNISHYISEEIKSIKRKFNDWKKLKIISTKSNLAIKNRGICNE